ncbi:type VII secretion-associated protein [Corynebacterium aquatimens]|uniref:Type VII secretion-associated protein (TIGR03931 family) n=1 Tax=Corynebacterium aquatimens TaxID=1190508 RepID=A0A931GWS5_9CORY|nr:type VII secretion-associated protein [Corynebacterium aquatimens]MBG6123046.1 type VII secretion-associated protein (TIGR03931 family) [Corynebacterium aquatimens]WJY66620.1 hypothetical protein CAQUA_09665 [Corynebacterium aquatimens]
MADLTVTIKEGLTIFEGVSTVYRYDKLSVAELADHIRGLAYDAGHAGFALHLTATRQWVEDLTTALADADLIITATITDEDRTRTEEQHRAATVTTATTATTATAPPFLEVPGRHAAVEESSHDDDPPTGEFAPVDPEPYIAEPYTAEPYTADPYSSAIDSLDLERPDASSRRSRHSDSHSWRSHGDSLSWRRWAVAGAAVGVLAGSAWAIASVSSASSPPGTAPDSSHSAVTSTSIPTTSAGGSTGAAGGSSISESSSSTTSAPRTVRVEQEGLSVELPVGFTLAADEDMWRATGPDPNFRLQLAVDALYGVPANAMLDQVQREIDADAALTPLFRNDRSMRYQQKLDDGSEVYWYTWIDPKNPDYQLSLGCHTRRAPTRAQLATCQMATETARFTPP